MGFFDKVFGGKTAGGGSPADPGQLRALEIREKGFSMAVPQDWTIDENPSGLEAHPPECNRVSDPGSAREINSPGVTVAVSDIPDPQQNAVKETIRNRSTEMAGHRLVKHIAGEVKNADHGIVYEYQYGLGEAPIRALGAIAQKKNRVFIVSAYATVQDFDINRNALEAVVKSFKPL
jgi:hypothetical protein